MLRGVIEYETCEFAESCYVFFVLKYFAVLLGFVMSAYGPANPPQILEVYRDYLKPGSEDAHRKMEEEATRICVRLKFPHAYLTIESLTGPKEVWYFNGFNSPAEMKQLSDAYQKNAPLVAALDEIVKRKAPLFARDPTNDFTKYRKDLSRGEPWTMARGRFLVITMTKGVPQSDGTVFELDDGTRLIIRAAKTQAEAEELGKTAGQGTNIFAVRPQLCIPAKSWVAADSAFWKGRPTSEN